jgi:hypothetical protein
MLSMMSKFARAALGRKKHICAGESVPSWIALRPIAAVRHGPHWVRSVASPQSRQFV